MYEIIKKEFFNKEFLTSKSFIRMICFTMVLIFAVVMGSVFGYVSADGDTSSCVWLTEEEYTNSDVYDSSNYFQGYMNLFSDINNSNATISSNLIMDHDWSSGWTGQNSASYDVSEAKYYLIVGSAYPSKWRIYFFPDEVYMYVETSAMYTYYDIMSVQDFYYADITPWGDGSNLTDPYVIFPDTLLHGLGQFSSQFNEYFISTSTGSSTFICSTNMPIYTYHTNRNWTYGSYFNDLMAYIGGDDTANIVNVNYRYENGECLPLNGCDSLENCENYGSGGSSESSETSANNLYLNNSKWTFSIPKWSNLTGYSGNATFSSSLNDFQTDNLEDFYLRFQFRIDTTVSYVDSGESGTSGGGHGTSVTGNDISTGYLQKTFSYKDSTTGNNYKDVQLQYFYNQGCSQSFMTLNGIFDRCMLQKLSLNNSSSSDTSFYYWYNDAVNSNTHTVTKAMLYCYATLYDSDGGSSGNCTYYYNLLTGESGVTDSSMSINSNPVVDEDGNIEYDPSDDVGSGTSINNNNSNSGVNVNQTVNVNNDSGDSKSWLWTLVTNLVTSSSDDENIAEAGLTESLSTLVGINPWISICSTTFGFVPSTVWASLTVAFMAVLGIMVVAFVLRIILDLL